jgi:RNA polymerase sigma-70 factor (ECF subfamily)
VEDEFARRVVAAVLSGDRDAFRELIERESGAVVRICHRVLGNLHDAEDAAQEAFVTAYRSIGTWRGEGPLGAWLARIAVRVALRHAGRRSRTRELAWIDPPAAAYLGAAASEGGASARALGGDDPAQVVLRQERSDRVRWAVASLDEPYREVVALRFFGELSLAEIAMTSGRPIGTVKTHLHRGLLRLRSTLEGES